MIRHTVLWRFKRECEFTPMESARYMKEHLEALPGRIPGMLSAKVSFSCKEDAEWDAMLVSDFESYDALKAYKEHPLHVPIRSWCKEHREARTAFDCTL